MQQFPSSIFANMFNFQKYDYFKTETEAEKEPVKVNFDDVNEAISQPPSASMDGSGAPSTGSKKSGRKVPKS